MNQECNHSRPFATFLYGIHFFQGTHYVVAKWSRVVIRQKHNLSDEGSGLAKWFFSDVWLRTKCWGILREFPLYNHGRRTHAYSTHGHMVYRNLTLCIYKCMDLGFPHFNVVKYLQIKVFFIRTFIFHGKKFVLRSLWDLQVLEM